MPPSRNRVIRSLFRVEGGSSSPRRKWARLVGERFGKSFGEWIMKRATLFLAGAALLASTALVFAAAPTAKMKTAVADSGRPAADTARDENRKPAEMLAFGGIAPGKVVVDMLPGAGYFTRIFAKAVEPNGRVYAYFGIQYDARLKGQGKDPDMQFTDLKQSYKNLGVIHGPLPQFVT